MSKKVPHITEQEWQTCIEVLKAIARNPDITPDVMVLKGLVTKIYKQAKKTKRQQVRAGIIEEKPVQNPEVKELNDLVTQIYKQAKKTKQRLGREAQQAHDLKLMASTKLFQHHLVDYGEIELPDVAIENRTLKKSIRCYVCKEQFQELHFFYHLLCPNCAEKNHQNRSLSANLNGRIALITGGRIKIGFETALKLLRDGAKVIVTSRFPKDTAQRYAQQPDFKQWKDQLVIHGLDLRHLPSVEAFIQLLLNTLPKLDILINNAAQTIKRPWEFYRHLAAIENKSKSSLNASEQAILGDFGENQHQFSTQLHALASNEMEQFFPLGGYDQFGQALDLREHNSWSQKLDEVDTVELLEVQLVNSTSPFMLCSKLKPLFLKSEFARKFIVNVSAMEGQFAWSNKTSDHPHTNMAKAALNMLTRTAAEDYAQNGIFMNSVDTGWITEEQPHPKKIRKLETIAFVPPLDIIDGASRVYAPIATGINQEEIPVYGKFLKDYSPYAW